MRARVTEAHARVRDYRRPEWIGAREIDRVCLLDGSPAILLPSLPEDSEPTHRAPVGPNSVGAMMPSLMNDRRSWESGILPDCR